MAREGLWCHKRGKNGQREGQGHAGTCGVDDGGEHERCESHTRIGWGYDRGVGEGTRGSGTDYRDE